MITLSSYQNQNYHLVGSDANVSILFNPLLALNLFEFKDGAKDFLSQLNEGGKKILSERGYEPGSCYSFRGDGRLLEAIQAPRCEFGLVMIPSRLENFAKNTKFISWPGYNEDIESRKSDYQSFKFFLEKYPSAREEQIPFYCAYGLDARDSNLQNNGELLTSLFDFWVESAREDSAVFAR